ncbi:MAG TPA: hypothetical protein VF789_18085 [Thermoanaerobaculia bacterium]
MPDRKLLLLIFVCVCLVSGASASQRGAKTPPSKDKDRIVDRLLTDQEKQELTIKHIRNTGTAMFSWLTDQVGAGAAGAQQIDLGKYPKITHKDLEKLLVPNYLMSLPKVDGWGNAYEYRLNVKEPTAEAVMSIRSAGRDGVFSGDKYTSLKYPPKDLDQDIVWTDGFFAGSQQPAGGQSQETR